MYRFFFLAVALFLFSCSALSRNTTEIPQDYSDQNVREILGFMEISETDASYPTVYTILTSSEKPCIGRDFVGYRDCFIDNLAQEQQKYPLDEKLQKKFFLLDWGLKDERSFTGFYQEIDALPNVSQADVNGSCRIAGYRLFDNGAFTGEHFTLSYRDSQRELAELLSKSGNFSPKSLSGIITHENPCESYTWGPDVGNIFYFKRVGGNNYLFIKTSDGGGSGDFNYTIYYNPQRKGNLYMEIATLPAFAGFTPIPRTIQDKNGNQIGETHREIMEEFKNKPFQYITTFENQRIGYIYEIRDILRDITPEITYD